MPSQEEDIIAFVAEFTGHKRERIHLETTIAGDLGVAGDDGRDLIQEFGKKFRVDLAGFEPEPYFGPEDTSSLAPIQLLWMLFSYPFRNKRATEEDWNLQPVRIRDLLACAREGKWQI
jgi:hypothetical protein